MTVDKTKFGEIIINGRIYTEDIIIDNGKISKRNSSVSKMSKGIHGHTPLTIHENIPWDCSTLVVGTGMYGSLPVTDEVFNMAEEMKVKLVLKKTRDALRMINDNGTNFVLHLTC